MFERGDARAEQKFVKVAQVWNFCGPTESTVDECVGKYVDECVGGEHVGEHVDECVGKYGASESTSMSVESTSG